MKKTTSILKFGGTSVGSPSAIKQVVEIVADKRPLAIIVSAYSGVTDQLIQTAQLALVNNKEYKRVLTAIYTRHANSINELLSDADRKTNVLQHMDNMIQELESIFLGILLIKELSPKTLDYIMSFGERMSAYIISACFEDRYIPAEFVDARQLVKTDNNFSNARVNFKKTNKNIKNYFQKSKKNLKVITGYIGSTDENETTTLGRGGSDYTASIFGAALQTKVIEIWTDVSGVMTADPKKVASSFTIKNMTYQEAMEMSHFGAKVIHPPTIRPAMENNIPLLIKNTFAPEVQGTLIGKISSNGFLIKGISSISNISILLVQGSCMFGAPQITMRLFGALGKHNINLILISQASSEHTVCLAVDPKDIESAQRCIEDEFQYELREKTLDPLEIENDLSILAIVGEHMHKTPGVTAKLFHELGHNNINIVAIAQGSSELNISVVIEKKDEIRALNAVHDAFFKKV